MKNNGGLIQYTADVSERLLITHCKHPFTRTNKGKDFTVQIVRILDRLNVMQRFDVYTLLHTNDIPITNIACDVEDEEETREAAGEMPATKWQIQGPHPFRNYFVTGLLSNNAQTALHVSLTPDETNATLTNIAALYHLPDFIVQYQKFWSSLSVNPHLIHAFSRFALWYKFRVQLHSTFRPSMLLPSQIVQAKPPSTEFPLGCADAVLISPGNNVPSFVAQVRTVFQPRLPSHSKVRIPPGLQEPLLYVQPLHVVSTPEQQPEMRMWVLERNTTLTECGDVVREGLIVPLRSVSHAVDLAPVFGSTAVPATVSSSTSQEYYNQFYLNHYADKEIYNAVHGVLGGGYLGTNHAVNSDASD